MMDLVYYSANIYICLSRYQQQSVY